jgi:hypothetical protein
MIFHRSNYDDIKRYYANTIIKLPEISGDRLWQIVSMTPDEIKLHDVDGTEVYIDLNDEYEVDYPLPGRVVYQCADRACILLRRPAKQYYRGLHKENTTLSYYNADGAFSGYQWSIETLQMFVDKPAYQDPHTIVLSEGMSWALNKHMAVCRSGAVMVLGTYVAQVDWPNKTIVMAKRLFKSEVKEAFPGFTIV